MKILKVTVEVSLGQLINKSIDEAKVMARLLDADCVEFEFNGKVISVNQSSITQDVIDKYHEEF